MIKKEKLLKGVEKAIDMQKKLLVLIDKHISSAIPHSALSAEEKSEILERFRKMADSSARHTEMLNEIKQEVAEGDADVY